jgi:phosphoribosyl-dephospho-CoA transferase
MTFIQVLESEFYYLIEALEHGCSDQEVTTNLVIELKEKTGYEYNF